LGATLAGRSPLSTECGFMTIPLGQDKPGAGYMPEKKKRRIGIGVGVAIRALVALLLISTMVTAGIVLTFRITDSQKRDYFNTRLTQVETAAAALDYEDVEQLTGSPEDIGTPAYEKLRGQLVRIKNSDPHLRFVYLMAPIGDDLVFLLDAENPDSGEYSFPGQVYEEAKPGDLAVFEGRESPSPEMEGPVTDRWGTWISANAYVLDKRGSPLALVGTDVDVERALGSFEQSKQIGITFGSLAAALLVLLALQWIIWYYTGEKRRRLKQAMDESMRVANEELVETNRLKTEFVQMASHELRSPVNAVSTAIQTIDKVVSPKLDEEEKELLEVAKSGTRRLVDLLNNLLDVTRIEAGDFVFEPREIPDVNGLLERAFRMFEPVAEERGLTLEISLSPEPVDAFVDPNPLLRVLENLLWNSLKYTEEGGVRVDFDADDDWLHLEVADTGTGIPDELKQKVFEKFTRFDQPSGPQRGAGMGLALCRGLVEALGGGIRFESKEGEGTTFYVDLPRRQTDRE
jgi:signal transduction histidine kinase